MTDKIIVIHSDGTKENFKPRIIAQTIISETKVDKQLADRIQDRIAKKLYKLKQHEGLTEISTSDLRAEVSSQLLKEGQFEAVEQNRKLGMSVAEFEHLLEYGCKDNANIGYSPEMIAKYAYDSIAKEYALLKMPEECAEAHREGLMHIHDLEYYMTRPNCMNYDLRFFAKNGLKIDGKGEMGSVAKPAKSLEVLLNHMLQAWMAGATVFSGGQGYVNFNTLLAPFCKGRSYEDIKQAIQGFIFNCNMSLICRGGQVLFSSIALDLSIPEVLKDEPAISFGGVSIGTYKDYQEEADLVFRAVCEVSNEKDGAGAYHRFPNILFNIRKGDLDEYKGTCKILHETGANNPTIYYNNCIDLERSTMGALTIDTPVMTNNGFKYPNELHIGDNVMTYSVDGSKEWNKIYNIIEKEAPSKVFKITCDNGYEFKVTDNHKLPTSNGIVKSEDLEVGMELYDYVDVPFDFKEDLEKEFVGIFLADGFIRHKPRHRVNGNNIEFHFRKEWKKEYVEKLCSNLNYSFETKNRKDGSYTIYVKELNLRNELVKLYDDNLNIKRFPNYWDNKNSIANVLYGLMFDARIQGSETFVWSCSDKELVYDVCYAISYLGMKSTIYQDIRKGSTGKWKTNYRISFSKNFKPKNTTVIKSIELVDNKDLVYDLSIENNANYVCGLGGIHSENCRSSLPMNYRGNYKEDCVNTGNFMYNTINLPLIALEANGDWDDFLNKLNDICEICYTSLKHRREVVIDAVYNKHMSDFLLQTDKESGEPLWDIDRTTITIGYAGLNECLMVLFNDSIENEDVEDKGVCIIEFLNQKKQEFFDRDGLRWSVIASPAESTAFRFATINKEKYPQASVQGAPGAYYVTNSHHIPVKSGVSWIRHIQNANKFAHLSLGGDILHIWSGEVWSDPEAIWRLNQRILKYGNPIFWAYSKAFTFCRDCQFTINDKLEVCPICGSTNLRLFDRITGYYLSIDTFNAGKRQEFADRHRHIIQESDE